jgi:hypothetical protein
MPSGSASSFPTFQMLMQSEFVSHEPHIYQLSFIMKPAPDYKWGAVGGAKDS